MKTKSTFALLVVAFAATLAASAAEECRISVRGGTNLVAFADALANARDDSRIVLLKDVDLTASGGITLANGRALTLDLAGHTLKGDITVGRHARLSFQDGASRESQFLGSIRVSGEGAVLTVDGGYYYATNETPVVAVTGRGARVVLRHAQLGYASEAASSGVIVSVDAPEAEVELGAGTTVSSRSICVKLGAGFVENCGATLKTEGYGVRLADPGAGTSGFVFSRGTITGGPAFDLQDGYAAACAAGRAWGSVSGGTFSGEVPAELLDGFVCKAAGDGTWTVAPSAAPFRLSTDGGQAWAPVASVDELTNALLVTYAAADEVIVELQRDVPEGLPALALTNGTPQTLVFRSGSAADRRRTLTLTDAETALSLAGVSLTLTNLVLDCGAGWQNALYPTNSPSWLAARTAPTVAASGGVNLVAASGGSVTVADAVIRNRAGALFFASDGGRLAIAGGARITGCRVTDAEADYGLFNLAAGCTFDFLGGEISGCYSAGEASLFVAPADADTTLNFAGGRLVRNVAGGPLVRATCRLAWSGTEVTGNGQAQDDDEASSCVYMPAKQNVSRVDLSGSPVLRDNYFRNGLSANGCWDHASTSAQGKSYVYVVGTLKHGAHFEFKRLGATLEQIAAKPTNTEGTLGDDAYQYGSSQILFAGNGVVPSETYGLFREGAGVLKWRTFSAMNAFYLEPGTNTFHSGNRSCTLMSVNPGRNLACAQVTVTGEFAISAGATFNLALSDEDAEALRAAGASARRLVLVSAKTITGKDNFTSCDLPENWRLAVENNVSDGQDLVLRYNPPGFFILLDR